MVEFTKRTNTVPIVLRSGQPRPYADHEYVVEVHLNEGLTKQQASDLIEEMKIGYTTKDNGPFSPEVSYLRETSPGVWEFMMKTMYTG